MTVPTTFCNVRSYRAPPSSLAEREACIARDASAHQYYFSVAVGAPITSSRPHNPPPYKPYQGPHTDADNATNLIHMPRIPLDPKHQAYFYRMDRESFQTCHPVEIHSSAAQLSSLLRKGKRSPREVAMGISDLAFQGIRYSRTLALLLHDCMVELLFDGWHTKKVLEIELLDIVSNAFKTEWTSLMVLSPQGLF